ncbi:MAG: glutathione S-transferase N-terminal domain-containing protein [Candidatus Nanoarchaeia archaeon]
MLTLYHFEECPYCQKVRAKLQELDVKYISVPCPRGSKNRAELLELGSKEQVPFIVDGGVKMYESGDIIAYLEEKYS